MTTPTPPRPVSPQDRARLDAMKKSWEQKRQIKVRLDKIKHKVAVYSGILTVTKDENGMAVVLGHEIAHALARHGSERMSQGLLAQLGGVALGAAMSSKPDATQELAQHVCLRR
jgi:Zn-dependent protease with chaperone function